MTTYSITEAKIKLGKIAENMKTDEKISVLKNGKPLVFLITPEQNKKLEKLEELERRRIWEESLEYEEISEEFAASIADAKKEMITNPGKEMSVEEIMDYINS